MKLSCIVDITKHFKCTHIAITSGQCSSFPYEINDAVEISGCMGVEIALDDCKLPSQLVLTGEELFLVVSCYIKLTQWLIIQ